MQNAPALIGERSIAGYSCGANVQPSMNTTEKMKFTATAAFVARFQYRPYRNGARNAPAMAPHEMPIIWAMKVTPPLYWMMAITTLIAMNTTIRTRMIESCFFSFMSFTKMPLMKSSVRVELEVRTSEDNVDIDADSTSTITIAIRMFGSVDSRFGMMKSKPFAAT